MEEYLPRALQLGVDYKLFWSLNPRKLKPFVLAYELELKDKMEEMNFSSWMIGIYMSYSMASVLGENSNYPESPLSLFEQKDDEMDRSVRESELFGAYAAMFNKTFNKENNI